MKQNFDKAFDFVMKWEGYKSDDPDDIGGRTIFGVSERSHPETVKRLWDLPKAVACEEAKIFYKAHYWNSIGADGLPDKIDIFLFDVAVNMGVSRAMEWRDEIGYNLFDLIMIRIGFYVNIAKRGNNIKFLRGWLNRVIDLYEVLK